MAAADVTAPTATQVGEALERIETAREDGTVYVHCWGGCGRTGVVLGCYLVEHGWPPADALARVQALTRAVQTKPCPETPAQIAAVTQWSTAHHCGGAEGAGTSAESQEDRVESPPSASGRASAGRPSAAATSRSAGARSGGAFCGDQQHACLPVGCEVLAKAAAVLIGLQGA